MRRIVRRAGGIAALVLLLPVALHAAPFKPASDAQVLERVPARGSDPRTREIEAMRIAWKRDPNDPDAAVALARRWFEEALARGDPRFVGHAQAVLAPWWTDASPPPGVRIQRAKLLQYNHRFDEALADLDAAVAAAPDDPEAWADRAGIRMVRADYAGARRDCEALAPLTTPLLGTACVAFADSMSGRIDEAARAITAALAAAPPDTDPAARLWALTRAAEIEERRGAYDTAEQHFRAALAPGIPDVYLLAAYADFLLDRNRAAEVLGLLGAKPATGLDPTNADVLLLRLALAAYAVGDARATAWTRELAERFDAARARGDSTHAKEESRFARVLQGNARRAVALARANFAVQREVADARVLLEAALDARDPAAATPALEWMRSNRVQAVVLQQLAQRIEAMQ